MFSKSGYYIGLLKRHGKISMKLGSIVGSDIDDRYDQREGLNTISLIDVANATRQFFNRGNPNHIKLLSGGFRNTNYLLDYGDERFVIRFFTESPSVGECETCLLRLAKANGICVPDVIDYKIIDGRGVAALRFVDGELLSSLLYTQPNIAMGVFTEVGAELARIHSLKFPTAGHIGAGCNLVHAFPDFCNEAKEYLLTTLSGIASTRLDPRLTQRLRETAEQYWHLVYETYNGPTLVHSDFNPKNILVTLLPEPQVTAVLDWEFSMAGHPLIDFGNFFRFEKEDYPTDARAAFIVGYQRGGGLLPEGWEKAAKLLDLTSMVDFLSREGEYPKTFHTARTVIASILKESETWE